MPDMYLLGYLWLRYTVLGTSVYLNANAYVNWLFFCFPQSLPILVCEWNIANHCPSLSHPCVVSFFPPDLPSKYLHLHNTQQPAILPVASSPLLDNPSHSPSKCSQEV